MATIDLQVGAGADDGARYSGDQGFVSNVSNVLLGHSANESFLISHNFARWTGVTFSGTVDVSNISMYPNGADIGTPELDVFGVDEDNPAAPTSAAEFNADPLTTASVAWDGTWTTGVWNQSPSLNGIFQELANSYTIDNEAVMVQVKDGLGSGNNRHNPRQYELIGNLHGAKLHVEYTAAGAARRIFVIS